MGVGPRDIRSIRTDSLINMGVPAATDEVLIRDVTDGVVKIANVSDVGITDHGNLAGLADFTADHGTSHDSHDHSTALGTTVISDISNVVITTPTTADTLYFNGTNWVNQALAASDIQSGTFADARIAQSNVTQHQGALAIGTSQVTTGTFADARIAQSNVTQHQAALSITASQVSDFNEAYQDNFGTGFFVGGNRITGTYDDVANTYTIALDALDASDVTTGTFADARISQTSVTQHQAALSITESQISDLVHYTSSNFTTDFNASNFDNLANVTITSVTANEVIAWSGTAWTNQTPAEAGLAQASHTHSQYVINDAGVTNIQKITQAAYDGLGTKDATTLYVIVG